MDHPVKEIAHVIENLCCGSPQVQKETLETHFTEDAAFKHPICRVDSFKKRHIPFFGELTSRWVILTIYQWYKIMSPVIILDVKGAVFDQKISTLYVSIFQDFSFWFFPIYHAKANLVTVLTLVQEQNGKYKISSQEDLYQSSEVVKFFWPFGTYIINLLQISATIGCFILSYVFAPITWFLQSTSENGQEKRAVIKGL